MARESISITIGGQLGNGDFLYTAAQHGTPSTTDTVAAADAAAITAAAVVVAQASVSTAKLATAAAKTDIDDADTAAGVAKLSTAACKVAAAAAQAGIVPLTTFTAAIATMKATPNQTNADAVDTLYSTESTGIHDLIIALDGLVNAAKNASDTADTDTGLAKTATAEAAVSAATSDSEAGTAKTDTDALDMTDVTTNLAAHAIDESADVVLDWNTTTIDSESSLHRAMHKVLEVASRGY